MYESLVAEAVDCVWATELRRLPLSTLCSWTIKLILLSNQQKTITLQFARQDMKIENLTPFFKDGHIRKTHVGAKGGIA